jgi:hypothetical protein
LRFAFNQKEAVSKLIGNRIKEADSLLMMAIANIQTTLRTEAFNLEKGLAIRGYESVAYFTQNKSVKVTKQFDALVEGVTYYFSTI